MGVLSSHHIGTVAARIALKTENAFTEARRIAERRGSQRNASGAERQLMSTRTNPSSAPWRQGRGATDGLPVRLSRQQAIFEQSIRPLEVRWHAAGGNAVGGIDSGGSAGKRRC